MDLNGLFEASKILAEFQKTKNNTEPSIKLFLIPE